MIYAIGYILGAFLTTVALVYSRIEEKELRLLAIPAVIIWPFTVVVLIAISIGLWLRGDL